MKKFMVLGIVCGVLLSSFSFAFYGPNGRNKPRYENTEVMTGMKSTEDIGFLMAQGVTGTGTEHSDKTLLNSFLSMFWLNTFKNNDGVPNALVYIRFIINLLLWLVSFIALVMIIYSFYLMFFSEDTQGMERVKKNLKGVAIALVILGLSRIIVSFIFNFYQDNLKKSVSSGGGEKLYHLC